ncbi:hypothetical protein F2Q69_00020606 [Brassica cretica]|uniref:Uncharacterized protein n=1 Tax=Brassica cretica TaxID=69181 RepID=A0A8S9Q502_BRACR|nr:hypothetical protein F2Q69_00020606 [Brassica cretica]
MEPKEWFGGVWVLGKDKARSSEIVYQGFMKGDPRSDRIDLRRSLDERCKVRARAQRSLGYDLVTVGAANGARETAGDRLAVTGQKQALVFLHLHWSLYIQPEKVTLQISYLSHITSDTATENQKNTTVTDQNTISLSLSDESKSTALTDSVDNSPQAGAVSDETVECSSLLDQIELEFEAAERRKMLEGMVA